MFAVGSFVAYRNLPGMARAREPLLLALAVVMAVGTVVINGFEFRLIAVLCGHPAGVAEAVHVSVLSRSANTRPIPGADLIKARPLRQENMPLVGRARRDRGRRPSVGGDGGLLTGTALVLASDGALGAAFLAATWILLAVAFALLRPRLGSRSTVES